MKSWNFITHKQKLHWGYRILLMENQGKAFGSIYWYFDEPRDLYIDMISVSEESQQKGLGTFLLKKLEYICVNDLSAEKISLWTFKNSWTKNGIIVVDIRMQNLMNQNQKQFEWKKE